MEKDRQATKGKEKNLISLHHFLLEQSNIENL
jgi:hypothetical protein